jgi:hypothetical protein
VAGDGLPHALAEPAGGQKQRAPKAVNIDLQAVRNGTK